MFKGKLKYLPQHNGHVLPQGESFSYANTDSGIQQLLDYLQPMSPNLIVAESN